ncbi:MAG: hypothetical protein CMQ68_00050 [Gammaproteobacteria bacterium]|nr:hypothetical protein [Gammaproteobacteria bacterium]|tara:strand:+ start:22660 stop:23265 length:606 start_codon:yes stop_codon:yes gene_type:complete
MQTIEIKNIELKNLLNDYSEWFENLDKTSIKVRGEKDIDEYYTSEEYLSSIDKKIHEGFPEKTHGIDLVFCDSIDDNIRKRIRQVDMDFNSVLGSERCAVKMYYPEGGYMGWHNNHNASGYNILFSYTKSGKGFFRYKTDELVTMNDSPGWTAKVGYYGNNDEPDKLFWHCARAYEDRLTLGFVIPNKNFWEMMIEDIESE